MSPFSIFVKLAKFGERLDEDIAVRDLVDECDQLKMSSMASVDDMGVLYPVMLLPELDGVVV